MASVTERINSDLKQAMLAGDKPLVLILRSLKSAILYKEVESGKRDTGLDEQEVLAVLKKEKKSRQDAYDTYVGANETERADEEKYQMDVIDRYVPAAPSEEDTRQLVEAAIQELGLQTVETRDTGAIMKLVKEKNSAVEGGVVSKIIKERAGV